MFGSFSASEVVILLILGAIIVGFHRLFVRSPKVSAVHPSQAAKSICAEVSVPKTDESSRSQCSEIGIPLTQIPSVCPSCTGILEKAPGKKATCPLCGSVMYVRTRPKDNVRVLVTESQTKILEEEWLKATGRYEAYQQSEQEKQEAEGLRAQIRQRLRQRFGKEPSDTDVEWGYLNETRLQQGLNRDWKSYRDTTFRMANQLSKEGKLNGALGFYLEVCFYDLNGCRGLYEGYDPEWAGRSPFNPDFVQFQSDVVAQIQALSQRLGFNKDVLKNMFLEHNRKVSLPKIQLSPENCWGFFDKKVDLKAQPAGYFDGQHYMSCIDEVKVLKREGNLDRAAELLLKAVEATEAEAKAKDYRVAPWYFHELAIVYRKLNNLVGEKDILERCLQHLPNDSEAKERLKKVKLLMSKKGIPG